MVNLLKLARERVRFDKRWFFLLYLLLGIPYLVLTGPFRVPDERNHFLRSYEVSELRLYPFRISGGYPGDNLPSSLSRLSEALGDHADHHIQPAQMHQARSLPLLPGQREFAEFATSAVYSPLAYVPSAVSIAIGRAFGAGPLALVYFARWGNLLAGAWLISLAISYAGPARPAALNVALFPMTLAQVASVSADAMTYGLSFLWVALVMEMAAGQGGAGRKRIVLLVCLALALSQLRPPYPFLGLLVFLIPVRRFGGPAAILVCSAIFLASFLPAVAWNAAAARLFVNPVPEQNIDPASQMAWVLENPGIFWHHLKRDLKKHGLDYWAQLVGRLGWLNIHLPSWVILGFAVAFAASVFTGPRGPPSPVWWQRIVLAVVILGGVGAIQLSQYLSFNPVGSRSIHGVQGRYFVPFAFAAGFAFSNSLLTRAPFDFLWKVACSLFVVSAHICAFFVLARAAGKI